MNTTGKVILAVIVLALLALLISTTGKGPSSTDPIRIGFIGPLTGDVAGLGTASRAAVEIAVEEANSKGGISGRTIEVVYEDGKCSPAPATSAAQKLIGIDKVSAIVGGLCSGETAAFAPQAMQNKVITVSYCSSSPALSSTGKYFFRTYPSDAYQGKFAAEYAYDTLGARKIAVIYHITDWGTGIKDVFVKRFTELGGDVTAIEGTQQDARDYRTQIAKVRSAGFDYVYIPLYVDGAIALIKQLSAVGIDGSKILGTEVFNEPKFLAETKGMADGTIITASEISPSEGFATKLTAKTGGTEVPICVPQAYDATKAILMAMEKVGTDPDKLQEAIRESEFIGESGSISFDQNGDPKTSNYVVKKVQNGALVDIK